MKLIGVRQSDILQFSYSLFIILDLECRLNVYLRDHTIFPIAKKSLPLKRQINLAKSLYAEIEPMLLWKCNSLNCLLLSLKLWEIWKGLLILWQNNRRPILNCLIDFNDLDGHQPKCWKYLWSLSKLFLLYFLSIKSFYVIK